MKCFHIRSIWQEYYYAYFTEEGIKAYWGHQGVTAWVQTQVVLYLEPLVLEQSVISKVLERESISLGYVRVTFSKTY